MLRFGSRGFFAASLLFAGWSDAPNGNFGGVSPLTCLGVRRAAANSCSYGSEGDGSTCNSLTLYPPSDVGTFSTWTKDNTVIYNTHSTAYIDYSSGTAIQNGRYRAESKEEWHQNTACCSWDLSGAYPETPPPAAFDRVTSTYWHTQTGASGENQPGTGSPSDALQELWLVLPFYAHIYWYGVRARNGGSNPEVQTPSSVDVYGSATAGTFSWTQIGSYSNELTWSSAELRTFATTDSTTGYQAIRFHLKRISATGATDFMSLAEIEIYGDIDECSTNVDDCHSAATCTDTTGSFTCACNSGYSGDGVSSCTNIDECSTNVDDCHNTLATCTDTTGSFTCACNTGYSGGGVSCTNIDECSTNVDDCHNTLATCTDTTGSFTCACNTGYSGGGVSCTNIDECSTNVDDCHNTLATCTDTTGSFTCACNSGYSGDGVSSCTSEYELTVEETEEVVNVLVTAGEAVSQVIEESGGGDADSTNVDGSSEQVTNAQTKTASKAVQKLAQSWKASISQSTTPSRSRAGMGSLGTQLPLLKSLTASLKTTASAALVDVSAEEARLEGTATVSAVSAEALAERKAELDAATNEVIATATETFGSLVLQQAGSTGSSELSLGDTGISVAATALGSPTAVADAREISAQVGSLSVAVRSLPLEVTERLRKLGGTCRESSQQPALGLIAVNWGGDIRVYGGGSREFGGSRSVRLMSCGQDVSAEIFGSSSITVEMKVPDDESSGGGRRRRLGRRGGRAEEDCGSWESEGWTASICQSAAAGECGCTGEGTGLLQTEYGFFASVLLDVVASPDLSVLWRFESASEGFSADNLSLWVFLLLLLGFICHLITPVVADFRSPTSSLSLLESFYLSNRPVLAAAWDSALVPRWGSLRFYLRRLQQMATDCATVSEGKYQHFFSIEAAYPLTQPQQPPESELKGEGEGGTEEESDDLTDVGGHIGYRQTELVSLLMRDALKVRKQIQVRSLLRKSFKEPDTSVVVVEPETCLIEDRNLSAAHLSSEQPSTFPLWDVRVPPALPVSLRFSLLSRWRRDLHVFPLVEEGWDHIAAARYLVQTGAFRERLDRLARQQALRWARARDVLRRWLRQRRAGGRRTERSRKDHSRETFSNFERRLADSTAVERNCSDSHQAGIQKSRLFWISLRGFLLPWSSPPPTDSSVRKVQLKEFGLDAPHPGGGGRNRASFDESRRKLLKRGSISAHPRCLLEDVWTSVHVSAQMEVSPRGFLKVSPLSDRLPWLEEDPAVSVLRLFVRCPNSPSGIVGLDISHVREVRGTVAGEGPNVEGFNSAAGGSESCDSLFEEGIDLLLQQGMEEVLEEDSVQEMTRGGREGEGHMGRSSNLGNSNSVSNSSNLHTVQEHEVPGRSDGDIPGEVGARGKGGGREEVEDSVKMQDPIAASVAWRRQGQMGDGGEGGKGEKTKSDEDLVGLSILVLEGEERLRSALRALPIWKDLEKQVNADMRRHRERVEGLVSWRRQEIYRQLDCNGETFRRERGRRNSHKEPSAIAAERNASIFRATKKWILPETYRAFWLHKQKRRETFGCVFCLFWLLCCFFYFACFVLVYPIRFSNVIGMAQSALGLFIVNAIVRPLILAAFVGISCSVLVNIFHRPDIAL
uniref:EGF-like domain-containing protein n=1 Tax=Chromera velia CCMP2878 TaxID=1169474 RepID=A0A0G4FA80_9ALVE|eukprot:Cvel_15851.t1-p1 / transcript=Cvel_15851.t1 / gene=Cvel_15851 / organism=Chromera_velia_CCMP2878 / gene_product=Fibrillin-1, putative / transcript_product=Fibrillin-1, putative / location=Cvel_scaffold1194:5575-18583(-) / protein_length=1619 / sequence_SO=supercontig / SO=protein_coding / is_pseudo=false